MQGKKGLVLLLQAGQSLSIGVRLLDCIPSQDGILLMDEGDPMLQECLTEEQKSEFFDFTRQRQTVLQIEFVLIDYIDTEDVLKVYLLLDILHPADQRVLAVYHLGVSQHGLSRGLTNDQDAFGVHDSLVLLHVGGEYSECREIVLYHVLGVTGILCLIDLYQFACLLFRRTLLVRHYNMILANVLAGCITFIVVPPIILNSQLPFPSPMIVVGGWGYIIIRMGFDSFLSQLQVSGWPQAVCLVAQVCLSGFVFANIRRHARRFPIKQLSPICTLFALGTFLLINLLSVLAREIEQDNGYYQFQYYSVGGTCGQCRIYGHSLLKFIALAYTSLRDLPLVIFALKTVRVSICFLQPQKRELPKWVVALLQSEWRIIGLSCGYVGAIFLFNILELETVDGLTPHSARLTFQLLCPKQSGILDWVSTVMRYVFLAVSYSLSIKAYKELDFKRFLFLIFLLSNTQGVVRAVLVLLGIISTTYHEFYYHSLLLNLLGTLLLLPYSEFNLNVNQPPGAAVLQNFQAFINYLPGTHILRCYALHRDHQEETTKYSQCFQACLSLRKIKMEVTIQSSLMANYRSEINRLLGGSEVAEHIEASRQMRQKISRQAVQLSDVKKLQRQLLQFCEVEIFRPWKKTESRDYVEREFRANMVIDEKMKQLGVEIGA